MAATGTRHVEVLIETAVATPVSATDQDTAVTEATPLTVKITVTE